MEHIQIGDITMKQPGLTLTFKEKLELSKLLDRLGVSVIELNPIKQPKIDGLLIKSIASAVQEATIAAAVELSGESVSATWKSLQFCKKARLQVVASVSPVQMEYLYHRKPDSMLKAVSETVEASRKCGCEVEFIAEDATRSEFSFLCKVIECAIQNGAQIITLCDDAGSMLPQEIASLIDRLYEAVSALKTVRLGLNCLDTLYMANACCVEAIRHGVREIKAAGYAMNHLPINSIAHVLAARGDEFQVDCSIRHTSMKRILEQIDRLCDAAHSKSLITDNSFHSENDTLVLSSYETPQDIGQAAEKLGYDLSEDDLQKVYTAFTQAVQRKESITLRELDAIVAAEAMQVPPAWKIDSYVINTGSSITAMAHMKLTYHDQLKEGISLGDGAIDAAFLAIEQATGRHFELDDFQIQAVTQGREAMGETIVKLRHNGKVYAGRGISTDIVGASVMAYFNALNKIVYEEDEA